MAGDKTDALESLIGKLVELPGLGRRSAERIVFHLLAAPANKATELARAIHTFRKSVRPCVRCHNLTDKELCSICASAKRDTSKILVVEYPADLQAFENAGAWDGVYHVLMGRLAPMAGVDVGDINIKTLVDRVASADPPITEIVLGTSATMEGDVTAGVITDDIRRLANGASVRISRIARGLPSGSEISFAQAGTLQQALIDRKNLSETSRR